jgi:hypothetical protein
VFGIPVEFLVVGGIFAGFTIVLLAMAGTCGAVTLFRRSVRHCRISWRSEGWGGPKHKNQEIPLEPPGPGAWETIKALFLHMRPAELPERSGNGSDPPPLRGREDPR